MKQAQYAALAARLRQEAEEILERSKRSNTAEHRKELERDASRKRAEAREADELANDRGY